QSAVAAHGLAGDGAALRLRDRAIAAVHVRDEVARDEILPVTRDWRVRVVAAAVAVSRIRHDDDQLADSPFPDEDFHRDLNVEALVRSVRPARARAVVSMEQIKTRVPALRLVEVTRRQKDRHVAVSGVTEKIPLEGRTVDRLIRQRALITVKV